MADTTESAGGARRDPRRRRALLEAADRVIRRVGPAASMASIAAEAGISKPILYRHFGNKSGLYQALAERHTSVLIKAIDEAFSTPDAMRSRTRGAIDTYLTAISTNPHLYRFLIRRASAEDAATRSAMSIVGRRLGDRIAETVIAEVRPVDPLKAHVWGHAAVGMVQIAGDWWLDHPEVPCRTVIDGLVDLIMVGLPAAASRS